MCYFETLRRINVLYNLKKRGMIEIHKWTRYSCLCRYSYLFLIFLCMLLTDWSLNYILIVRLYLTSTQINIWVDMAKVCLMICINVSKVSCGIHVLDGLVYTEIVIIYSVWYLRMIQLSVNTNYSRRSGNNKTVSALKSKIK